MKTEVTALGKSTGIYAEAHPADRHKTGIHTTDSIHIKHHSNPLFHWVILSLSLGIYNLKM